MVVRVSSALRAVVAQIDAAHWADRIKRDYGFGAAIEGQVPEGGNILRQTHQILGQFPKGLVQDCGVSCLVFRDLGPNRSHFPNHGFFSPDDKSVTLNTNIFLDPDFPPDFFSHEGYFVSRPEQTLFHEFGHAWDENNGTPSMKPDWLQLSGWSSVPKRGLKQILIKEKGCPEHRGEWYYDPKATFTRFYGKKNPWDDWADCFSFFISQARAAVPSKKKKYFQNLLGEYYR